MPKRFEELTAGELAALPKSETVFLFPLGVMEDHGPHLPLGLDWMEAKHLASALGEKIEQDRPGWVSVILPAFAAAADAETTQTAFPVRAYVVRDWLVDTAGSLWRKQGFRFFVCVSGSLGPRQLSAIEDAGKLLTIRSKAKPLTRFFGGTKPVLMSASSAFRRGGDALGSPLWSDPREHGGKTDTSVALELAPDLVRPSYVELPGIAREQSWWKRAFQRKQGKTAGYWGSPAEADAQFGAQTLQDRVGELVPKIHAVLDGQKPERVFKSWYSIFPSNQSFFRAWFLGFILTMVLVAWVYWTIKSLLN